MPQKARTSPTRKKPQRNHDPQDIQTRSEVFRLLGYPVRLIILQHLHDYGPSCVGDLVELAGIAFSSVSQHLAKLKAGGLVKCTRGRTDKGQSAQEMLYEVCWDAPYLASALMAERVAGEEEEAADATP